MEQVEQDLFILENEKRFESRHETKMPLSFSDQIKLKGKLLAQGMKQLYPPRKINSTYFDTNEFLFFYDSEEGVLPREKVRLRHYNEDKTTLLFERKRTVYHGKKKFSVKISRDKANQFLSQGLVYYGARNVYPCVSVSYLRSYFFLKNIRITFDSNIAYQLIGSKQVLHDKLTVVEFKFPIGTSDTIKGLSLISSRFSKYNNAIKYTYGF